MGVLELISGAETDYEFTLLQLILLMELADAESVFTYPLPEDGEFTDEDYILAMHDLIGRGFVEVTEEADGEKREGLTGPVFSLSKKAADLFGNIFCAGLVLESVSAW